MRLREFLCTLGNGYFAIRGAAPEWTADSVHCPKTYVAGCCNRLTSQVAGRQVENEDMADLPNWLPPQVRHGSTLSNLVHGWMLARALRARPVASCRRRPERYGGHAGPRPAWFDRA